MEKSTELKKLYANYRKIVKSLNEMLKVMEVSAVSEDFIKLANTLKVAKNQLNSNIKLTKNEYNSFLRTAH